MRKLALALSIVTCLSFPAMLAAQDNAQPPTKCAKCGLTHGGGERNQKVGS